MKLKIETTDTVQQAMKKIWLNRIALLEELLAKERAEKEMLAALLQSKEG